CVKVWKTLRGVSRSEGKGGRGQRTGSERHSRGNTRENTRRLGRCLSTAGANYNARIKGNHALIVDGSLGTSTSVSNGGYYLKVKQVAPVEADQDVVIKAGAVRQIKLGTVERQAAQDWLGFQTGDEVGSDHGTSTGISCPSAVCSQISY